MEHKEFSPRFVRLANKLAGKQKPPEWMVLAVLQQDVKGKVVK